MMADARLSDSNPKVDGIGSLDHSSQVSLNQEQICLLEAFYPGTRAYNAQSIVYLSGAFDVAIFNRAMNRVFARHEALRTTICLQANGYEATVHPQFDFQAKLHDLSDMPSDKRSAVLETLKADSMGRTFDLERLPLLDVEVVRLGEDEWQLLHVEHHVVHDGWSFGLLWHEVQKIYNALKDDQRPLPKPPGAQYQQFVTWQRSKMGGAYGEKAVSFWRDYLQGANLEVSVATQQGDGSSLAGINFEQRITPERYKVVKEAAKRFCVSEFVVMFSVFSMLLAKKTGQSDFAIGTAVSARTETEIETMIGMVVNTVPVRVSILQEENVRSACRSVQKSLFKTFRYQDLPLSRLVRELGIVQKKGKNPIFQNCFSFHDSDVPGIELENMEGYIEEAQNQTSKFDINVVAIPASTSRGSVDMRMFWQFADGRFSHEDCSSLIEEYLGLLDSIGDID